MTYSQAHRQQKPRSRSKFHETPAAEISTTYLLMNHDKIASAEGWGRNPQKEENFAE
jgi:hypothetical protein